MKGVIHDTDNLGQQFKSLTLPILRMMTDAKLIEREDLGVVKRFKASNGSIEEFK